MLNCYTKFNIKRCMSITKSYKITTGRHEVTTRRYTMNKFTLKLIENAWNSDKMIKNATTKYDTMTTVTHILITKWLEEAQMTTRRLKITRKTDKMTTCGVQINPRWNKITTGWHKMTTKRHKITIKKQHDNKRQKMTTNIFGTRRHKLNKKGHKIMTIRNIMSKRRCYEKS